MFHTQCHPYRDRNDVDRAVGPGSRDMGCPDSPNQAAEVGYIHQDKMRRSCLTGQVWRLAEPGAVAAQAVAPLQQVF